MVYPDAEHPSAVTPPPRPALCGHPVSSRDLLRDKGDPGRHAREKLPELMQRCGYAVVNLTRREAAIVGGALQASEAFFAQSDAQKRDISVRVFDGFCHEAGWTRGGCAREAIEIRGTHADGSTRQTAASAALAPIECHGATAVLEAVAFAAVASVVNSLAREPTGSALGTSVANTLLRSPESGMPVSMLRFYKYNRAARCHTQSKHRRRRYAAAAVASDERSHRQRPHADIGMMSVAVPSRDTPGLYLYSLADDAWTPVEALLDRSRQVLVFPGQEMARLTGGALRPLWHEVRVREGQQRHSAVYFARARRDVVLDPLFSPPALPKKAPDAEVLVSSSTARSAEVVNGVSSIDAAPIERLVLPQSTAVLPETLLIVSSPVATTDGTADKAAAALLAASSATAVSDNTPCPRGLVHDAPSQIDSLGFEVHTGLARKLQNQAFKSK